MKSNDKGTASGPIDLAIFLITIVIVLGIEAKFNIIYSFSSGVWWIELAIGAGVYILLSVIYFFIAKLFKLPKQRTKDFLKISVSTNISAWEFNYKA